MEPKKLEILIVEDNPKHLDDAKAEVQRRIDTGEAISADYAISFKEAEALMNEKRYHGIVSDIFFPYDDSKRDGFPNGWSSGAKCRCMMVLEHEGVWPFETNPKSPSFDYQINIVKAMNKWMEGSELHPTGMLMVEKAIESGIPIVLCTDAYHHGFSVQPVFQYANKKGVKIVDSHDGNTGHAATKNWAKALDTISEK